MSDHIRKLSMRNSTQRSDVPSLEAPPALYPRMNVIIIIGVCTEAFFECLLFRLHAFI